MTLQQDADKKYGGNGWNRVERLVLYRLDTSEANIANIRTDLAALTAQRVIDIENARKERQEQYDKISESLVELKNIVNNAALVRSKEGNALILREVDFRELSARIKRLEKILYGIIGTGGLAAVRLAVDHFLGI